MIKLPSRAEVNRVYSYNPDNGIFTRIIKCKQHNVGDIVKAYETGYIRFTIDGSKFLAHRIAWMLINSDPCEMQIDHINHDRSDNRIKNLRLATNTENHKNATKQKNNKSGFVGVHWCNTTSKFRATIKIKGLKISLGYKKTIIDAVILRIKANIKYGFHKNHGML